MSGQATGQIAFAPARLNEAIDAELLSHAEAARRLGVPERTLDRWRKGDSHPRRAAIRRMAEVFEREPLWFCSTTTEDAAA